MGHCFVSYDLPASSQGFTFTGTSGDRQAIMGDTLLLQGSAMLQVSSPHRAKLRLLQDGRLLTEAQSHSLNLVHLRTGSLPG